MKCVRDLFVLTASYLTLLYVMGFSISGICGWPSAIALIYVYMYIYMTPSP